MIRDVIEELFIACFILGLAFFMTTWIMTLPIKIVFTVVLFFLTYFLFKYLTLDPDVAPIRVQVPKFFLSLRKAFSINNDLAFLLLYLLSIILVILVPPINSQFLEWCNIPILNWLRLFSAICLSTFFPGYVIFRIIERKRKISRVDQFLFSCLLSLFFVPLSSYIQILLVGGIGKFGTQVLIGFAVFFLLLFFISARKEFTKRGRQEYLLIIKKNDFFEFLALLCIVAFILLGTYAMALGSYPPIRIADPWDHYGCSLHLLKEFPTYVSFGLFEARAWPFYVWWYYMYVSSFFVLSGFPTINAYAVLTFLTALPVIAFYKMASSFLKERYPKLPITATTVLLFLGFGWIGTQYLKMTYSQPINLFDILSIAGNKSMDIYWFVRFFPYFLAPMQIGFSSFFVLLGLLASDKTSSTTRYFLITIFVALGYLMHIAETPTLIFTFALLFFFYRRHLPARADRALLSVVLGMLVVLAIDLLAPGKFYTVLPNPEPTGSELIPSMAFIISIVAPIIIIFSHKFIERILWVTRAYLGKLSSYTPFTKYSKIPKVCFSLAAIYLYFLSLAVFFYILPQSWDVETTFDFFGVGITPWFFYPLRFGINGILGLIGFIYVLFNKGIRRYFVPVYCFLILFVSLSVFLPHFKWGGGLYSAQRALAYLLFASAILSAYTILELFRKLKGSLRLRNGGKKVIASFMLATIICIGVASTVQLFEYETLYPKTYPEYYEIDLTELEALDFLRNNVPSNSTILTATFHSQYRITSFAGIKHPEPFLEMYGDKESFLLNTTSPETLFLLLKRFNVKYVYLAQRDISALSNRYKFGLLSRLIGCLPIVFNNSKVTIYEVPPLDPPTTSTFGVVIPEPAQREPIPLAYVEKLVSNPNVEEDSDEDGMPDYWVYGNTEGSIGTGVWDTTQFSSYDHSLKIFKENAVSYSSWVQKIIVKENSTYTIHVSVKTDVSPEIVVLFYDENMSVITHTAFSVPVSETFIKGQKTFTTPPKTKYGRIQLRLWKNGTAYFDDIVVYGGLDPIIDYEMNYPLEMIALSKLSYTTFWRMDNAQFNCSTLMLTNDPVSYDVSNYVQWIEKGRTLIVLNSHNYGSFANLLNINMLNYSSPANSIRSEGSSILMPEITVPMSDASDNTVRTIAWYTFDSATATPFVSSKQIGKGNLFYVEIAPIFSTLKSSLNKSVREELFSSMELIPEILNISDFTYQNRQEARKFSMFVTGGINATGSVQLKSLFPLLPSAKGVRAELMDLSHVDAYVVNGTKTNATDVKTSLSNVTILNLTIDGPSEVLIDASSVMVQGNLIYGTYLNILLSEGFNWTINIPKNVKLRFDLIVENTTSDFIIEGGSIKFIESKLIPTLPMGNVSMLLKSLELTVQGNTHLKDMFSFPIPPRGIRRTISINGTTSLNIEQGDEAVMCISSIKFHGSIETSYLKEKALWSDQNIPWEKIMISWPHLILFNGIALYAIFQFKYKEKNLYSKKSTNTF